MTDVGLVNALGGSIFGATIIYIFPAALSLGFRARRLSHPSWEQLQLARFTLVAGVLFGVVGTIVTGMKYWGSGDRE